MIIQSNAVFLTRVTRDVKKFDDGMLVETGKAGGISKGEAVREKNARQSAVRELRGDRGGIQRRNSEHRSGGFGLRVVASRRRLVRLHRRWQSWPSPLEFSRK